MRTDQFDGLLTVGRLATARVSGMFDHRRRPCGSVADHRRSRPHPSCRRSRTAAAATWEATTGPRSTSKSPSYMATRRHPTRPCPVADGTEESSRASRASSSISTVTASSASRTGDCRARPTCLITSASAFCTMRYAAEVDTWARSRFRLHRTSTVTDDHVGPQRVSLDHGAVESAPVPRGWIPRDAQASPHLQQRGADRRVDRREAEGERQDRPRRPSVDRRAPRPHFVVGQRHGGVTAIAQPLLGHGPIGSSRRLV